MEMSDLLVNNLWVSTSVSSIFVHNALVSQPTARGRCTLLNNVLREVEGALDCEQSRRVLATPAELQQALAASFGIHLTSREATRVFRSVCTPESA